jgi:hypothetical protein
MVEKPNVLIVDDREENLIAMEALQKFRTRLIRPA